LGDGNVSGGHFLLHAFRQNLLDRGGGALGNDMSAGGRRHAVTMVQK
jgi:hypothetical protein